MELLGLIGTATTMVFFGLLFQLKRTAKQALSVQVAIYEELVKLNAAVDRPMPSRFAQLSGDE